MLVGALVVLLFASVVQLALAVHVRNTLVDCAGEGARYGAEQGHTAADATQRTIELIDSSLSPAYADQVRARRVDGAGPALLEVDVTAPLPVVGLLGPTALTVHGHALVEDG